MNMLVLLLHKICYCWCKIFTWYGSQQNECATENSCTITLTFSCKIVHEKLWQSVYL